MPDTLPTTEDTIETVPMPIGPFFRFPDEATGMAALDAAGLLTEDGKYITASHTHSLDVVGTITRGGKWDDEGNCLEPPTTLDGWHLNYSGELPEGWEQYAVQPANPVRVWAGGGAAAPATAAPDTVLVRARDDLGQYVADDPATPTDEAWVEVPLADA